MAWAIPEGVAVSLAAFCHIRHTGVPISVCVSPPGVPAYPWVGGQTSLWMWGGVSLTVNWGGCWHRRGSLSDWVDVFLRVAWAWTLSQPAQKPPLRGPASNYSDKLLQLRAAVPAGCQPRGPRLRHGSPFILIRGTPCVIKKSVYYCRHTLTAASIIVKRQMGGG